ncbi:hypothetical protein BGW38_002331, partial [Lunasporangiospora selenospora]
MRFSFIAIASAVAASVAFAAPVRVSKKSLSGTINILNFALTLEHLEDAFYKEGLSRYDEADFVMAGYKGVIRDRFVHIGEHEATHVTTLETVIKSMNEAPVAKCTYKFPFQDVHQFIAIARALENTGVSAYLGQAAGLDGDLLTAAASIATVEARHSSFLNEVLGETGLPYAFDTPLTAKEIFTIASYFIEYCPDNIGLVPFKQLTASIGKDDKVTASFEDEDTSVTTWC